MKLPVFAAFGASISFIAAHFLTLLRIVWLPALILTAASVYFTIPLVEAQAGLVALEAEAQEAAALAMLGGSLKYAAFITLVSAVFYPVMYGGALRFILRGERPPGFLPFYLWFGADEFRLLITYVVFAVMIAIAVFAGVLGVVVLSLLAAMLASAMPDGAAALVFVLIAVAGFVATIWFSLRMSLIFPATVGDRAIGIGRSWQVTRGAAWSLLFYWLLWGVVFLALSGLYAAFGAAWLFELLPEMIAAAGDEAAMAQIEERMVAAQAGLYDVSKPGFWVYQGATYAFLVVSTIFACAAGGVAYRHLAGEEG